jgi:hypothetical protein
MKHGARILAYLPFLVLAAAILVGAWHIALYW